MKKTKCFRHDYNARNDPKLQDLLSVHGVAGVGIYWCIVEMLYEQGGVLPMQACRKIAFSLHTTCKKVESVINDFGLFEHDENSFWSQSVKQRIERRNSVATKRKEAAQKRWQLEKESEEKPMQEADTPPIQEHTLFPEMVKKEEKSPPPPQQAEQPKKTYFIPPTVDEVREYIKVKGYPIDAETFVAFYESKGWMIGKNKMKNWHMALVTWMKQRNGSGGGGYRQTRSATTRVCNDEWK